jgi:acyl dehydratase
MADWSEQRFWDDVQEGDTLPSLEFPLTIHRLVVHVGANRDFSGIHHNADYARSQGAPDMYVNNVFALGMWERAVREYIGLSGVIKRMGPFRMTRFATPGETVIVRGKVARKWRQDDEHRLTIDMRSTISSGDCVVGSVTVALPTRPGFDSGGA